MKNQIKYEWDIETVDENGDVQDHNHADKLEEYQSPDGRLVLIRNEGNDVDGLTNRFWAYPEAGTLPEYFSDGSGPVEIKVPAKFHKELTDWLSQELKAGDKVKYIGRGFLGFDSSKPFGKYLRKESPFSANIKYGDFVLLVSNTEIIKHL